MPTGSLRSHVPAIFFVLGAEKLEDVAVGLKPEREADGEGLRVHLGVVHRRLHVDVTEVAPTEALYHAQLLAVRVSAAVQPALVVEAGRGHDEDVTIPPPDRVAKPERLRIGGRDAAIRVDLPNGVVPL